MVKVYIALNVEVDVVWLLVSQSWEGVWVVLKLSWFVHMDHFVKEVDRDVCGMHKVCKASCGWCGLGVVVMTRGCLI